MVHNNYAPNTSRTVGNITVAEWKERLERRLEIAREVWSGVDQTKSFHYDASLEDALAALAFCALVTLVLRQQERHGLAAFASFVGLVYGGAKGIIIGTSHHSVNEASIVLCSICGQSYKQYYITKHMEMAHGGMGLIDSPKLSCRCGLCLLGRKNLSFFCLTKRYSSVLNNRPLLIIILNNLECCFLRAFPAITYE